MKTDGISEEAFVIIKNDQEMFSNGIFHNELVRAAFSFTWTKKTLLDDLISHDGSEMKINCNIQQMNSDLNNGEQSTTMNKINWEGSCIWVAVRFLLISNIEQDLPRSEKMFPSIKIARNPYNYSFFVYQKKITSVHNSDK